MQLVNYPGYHIILASYGDGGIGCNERLYNTSIERNIFFIDAFSDQGVLLQVEQLAAIGF